MCIARGEALRGVDGDRCMLQINQDCSVRHCRAECMRLGRCSRMQELHTRGWQLDDGHWLQQVAEQTSQGCGMAARDEDFFLSKMPSGVGTTASGGSRLE